MLHDISAYGKICARVTTSKIAKRHFVPYLVAAILVVVQGV